MAPPPRARPPDRARALEILERRLRELDLEIVNREQLESLLLHWELLYRWNLRVNLTAIRDPIEGLDRHVLEGVEAASRIPQTAAGRVIDLGSGNGYPGIPALIVHPRLSGTLWEAEARKAAFLRAAIRVCQLSDRVTVVESRFERLDQLPPDASTVMLRGFPETEAWVGRLAASPQVTTLISFLGPNAATRLHERPPAGPDLAVRLEPIRSSKAGWIVSIHRG